jgi:NADH-quinone oxidoreductase subunit M
MIKEQQWLFSLGTFLPLAGVLVMLFVPKKDEATAKGIGLLTAAATLVVGIITMVQFD